MTAELVTAPLGDAVGNDSGPAGSSDRRAPLFSLSGIVRGTRVAARNAVIGGIAADEVRLERGFARMVLAGERAELRQAGAQLVLAGGDVTVERGGAQGIVANGSIRITQGGAGVAVGRRIEVGERGVVVFALAPSITVAGGRILVGPVAGLVMIAGLVATVLAAAGLRHRRQHTWRRR